MWLFEQERRNSPLGERRLIPQRKGAAWKKARTRLYVWCSRCTENLIYGWENVSDALLLRPKTANLELWTRAEVVVVVIHFHFLSSFPPHFDQSSPRASGSQRSVHRALFPLHGCVLLEVGGGVWTTVTIIRCPQGHELPMISGQRPPGLRIYPGYAQGGRFLQSQRLQSALKGGGRRLVPPASPAPAPQSIGRFGRRAGWLKKKFQVTRGAQSAEPAVPVAAADWLQAAGAAAGGGGSSGTKGQRGAEGGKRGVRGQKRESRPPAWYLARTPRSCADSRPVQAWPGVARRKLAADRGARAGRLSQLAGKGGRDQKLQAPSLRVHFSGMALEIVSLQSSQEDERPLSPFYLSAHVSQVNNIPATGEFLEKTIRTAVEQHLFDVHGSSGQSSEDSESGTSLTSSGVSTGQRRRHHKEQDEGRKTRDREVINKENIPSGFSSIEECILNAQEVEKCHENSSGYIGERSKPKRQKSSTKLSELNDNQESSLAMETFGSLRHVDEMEVFSEESKDGKNEDDLLMHNQSSSMKIQEHPGVPEVRLQRSPEIDAKEDTFISEVPRLDLSSLCSDNWEEPVPAFSSWQRNEVDSDEAHLSPKAGRLIQQLLDEDSDPLLSPRFYNYGQSQQYLDDTEVPPSPPNSHSFMRRRSSSLGSYEDDSEDLTPAQLTRRIQGLKKKIRRYEEKFEEERKYRPSHSDKAANLEVLKWTNDLAKFRKQLKESKLKISEEDLAPMTRQRSNTLPKSFGSQLEKEEEKQEVSDKSSKPSVEATLESMQKKLQEKRAEASRPEDIKDMTRDEIASEKVALQKSLLYYESIHGRPVTKHERQTMKPLYDRYRLIKQILSRANCIPIIGSPSSKRRSPLLQPIIEGETASFFKEIKEEEDGSEDDSSVKPDFTDTIKSDFGVRSFLNRLEDDADGFISPVDDRIPSRSTQDMGLSNLHAAPVRELVEQLQEVREDKKRIRKKLRDFEDNFFRQNGRNVQKEDRVPMAEEYNEYKQVKAKLRLLEVLISKRDLSSKIM
ncbi:protein FAM13A [Crotalus adamanteus]|uniref:Protein FAM13A n=1 Tax=Crotalus adamanteus TaxID=8729 RepID=A0AAW1BAI2_CROAD